MAATALRWRSRAMLGMRSGSDQTTYKGWSDGPIPALDQHRATFGSPLDIEPRGVLRAHAPMAPMISSAVALSISGRPDQDRTRIGPREIGPDTLRQRRGWSDSGHGRAKFPETARC